jgi:hypothetical protein
MSAEVEVGRITDEQAAVLDEIERVFGPVDPLLFNVKGDEYVRDPYGYKHWITRSLRDVLISWGQYKYAITLGEGPGQR